MNYLKALVLFLLIFVGLIYLSGQNAKQQLMMTLAEQLPQVVNPSLNNAIDESQELSRMSLSLLDDLHDITFVSKLPGDLVPSLTVTELNLSKTKLSGSDTLNWQFGNHALYASIDSSVNFNYWLVAFWAGAFTALGLLIDYLFKFIFKLKAE